MATTTTNYGFDVPTSSDLVKNGATQIALLGQDLDTFLFRPFTKNAVINGGHDVWQRSTSGTFAGSVTYAAADRWFGVSLGASPTCTISRQTADSTFLTYGLRFGRNSGQTGIGDVYLGNTFESIDARRFAGQTVTLSFYVKAGANAPLTLYSQIRTGTGTDQSSATLFSAGWTGGLNNSQTNTVTTTMTRYTQTVTLGSTVNQIMLLFTYTPTGTAGANEFFQIEGVQLEIGSQVSPFTRAGGTIQGELAACQRYYYRTSADASNTAAKFGNGSPQSATTGYASVVNPVPLRVPATSIDFANLAYINFGLSAFAASGLVLAGGSQSPTMSFFQFTSSGMTAGQFGWIQSNSSSSGYIGFSAEL